MEVPPTVIATEPTLPASETPVDPDETVTETPTAEPTAVPINTDAIVLTEGEAEPSLGPGESVEFLLHYTVTTPREATEIQVWLEGVDASAWTILAIDPAGSPVTVGGGPGLLIVDQAGLVPEGVIAVRVYVEAPREAETNHEVMLRATGTAVLADEAREAGASDEAPLATLHHVLPIGPGAGDGMISPSSVVNNSGVDCSLAAPHEVRPGEFITFSCSGPAPTLGSATYRVTSNTSGWLVSIARVPAVGSPTYSGPGTQAQVTGTGVLGNISLRVRIHAPAGIASGVTASALVERIDVSGPTSLITVRSTSITNDVPFSVLGLFDLYLFCANVIPEDQTIAPGQSLQFTCRFQGLLSLGAIGVSIAGTSASAGSPAGWSLSATGGSGTPLGSGTSLIAIDIGLLSLSVLENTGFTVTVGVPCGATSGSVTVNASLQLAGGLVGLANFESTVPITVTSAPLTVPSVASVTPVNFGTSAWTGASYPATNGALVVTLSREANACLANWQLQVRGTSLDLEGGGSIPISNMTYMGGTASSGITPLAGPIVLSGGDTPVATGSSAVVDGAQITLEFTLAPPDTAPVGGYAGTLTFTTASGPN